MIKQTFYKSFYGLRPEPIKQRIREDNYIDLMMTMCCQMFDYDFSDCPNELSQNLLEQMLMIYGCCVFGKIENKEEYAFGIPVFGDEYGKNAIDNNGVPNVVSGTSVVGEQIVDPVLIMNNNVISKDIDLMNRFAYELSRIDFAQEKLITNSLCNPIPLVKDESVKLAIEKVLKDSGETDPRTILDIKTFREQMDGQYKSFDLLDVTNVANAEKFKYLSSAHSDLVARLYQLIGFPMYSPTKQAQTNDSELQGRDDISMIYPMDRLKDRKIGMDKIKEAYGFDFKVKFNELWEKTKPEALKNETFETVDEIGDDENERDQDFDGNVE